MDDEELSLSRDPEGRAKKITPLWHKVFFWGSLFVIFVLVVAGVIYSVVQPQPVPSLALVSVSDSYWNYTLEQNPELATFSGIPGYNAKLSSISSQSYESQISMYNSIRKTLLDQVSLPTDPDELFNYKMLNQTIYYKILQVQTNLKKVPINQLNGVHIDPLQLFRIAPFQTQQDQSDYLTRLQALPGYINQVIAFIKDLRDNQNITLPQIVATKLPFQIQGVIDGIQLNTSVFYKNCLSSNSVVCQQIVSTIQTSVKAGYQNLYDFIKSDYIPTCRTTIATSDLPDGVALYNQLSEYFTTTTLTGDDIHNLGLAQVDLIYNSSSAIALKYNNTFQQFLEFLATSPQFYITNAEGYLAFIRDICKRADAGLPQLFELLPRCPYAVLPVPDAQAPSSPTAYYWTPDYACTRPGEYFVNTYNLTSRPLYLMESISLHEAVPGHHLQLTIQQETPLPPYRQFGEWNAFVEGWGLYSETLGDEMGFYSNDFTKFGFYSSQMLRACRLVVDTGIHLKNWTREYSIQYMLNVSGWSEQDVTAEVERYIAMPGQALGYKIGQLRIEDIKSRVSQALGNNFDIRKFHQIVIGQGAAPLSLLEEHVYDTYCQQLQVPALCTSNG